jgi:hypothetical protein
MSGMEFLTPLLTGLGTKLLGGAVDKMMTPKAKKEAAPSVTQPVKNLFSPKQIKQAQDKYTQTGNAKWNEIMANMGAGGGIGGPDITQQIGTQAQQLGTALGQLNTDSGYGPDPLANLDAILKGVEPGITPKYSVYG